MQLHYPLNPTTGAEDQTQLPWSNGVPQTGQEGSYPPYQAVVEPMQELVNLITLAGLTPSDTDLDQVTRAVRGGQLDFDATDTGTADAVLCQVGLAHTQILAGLPFTFVKSAAANTGNAVPTLTITDLNGNGGLTGTIVKSGGGALAKGDLPANALITVRARAPGVFAVVSLLAASDIPPAAVAAVNANKKTIPFPVGTSTWTCPTGITNVDVTKARGGGGGGGGCTGSSGSAAAGGGGGGASATGTMAVTPGTTYTVVVGAGGVGGSSAGSNGGTGGTTSFGNILTIPGGSGGNVSNGSTPAAAAAAGGGLPTVPAGITGYAGGPGTGGQSIAGTGQGGTGGGSYGMTASNLNAIGLGGGINAQFPACGGNGGGGGAYPGGTGGNGEFEIRY